MLSFMLQDHVAGRPYGYPFQYVKSVKEILARTHLLGEDLNDPETAKRKESMLYTAAKYWLDKRLATIDQTIKDMSALIRARYEKASV